MRGSGDELSVGKRIAFYRARRGLTQAELGTLVGRSEEWVSSIERGRRQARRLDVLTLVARALRVGLPDLMGQPVLMEDEERQGDDVPAIRDALMAPRRFSKLLFQADNDSGRTPDPGHYARFVEQIWFEYQAGRVSRVVAALPDLIANAQLLEDEPGEHRQGWAVSARVHHLAATTLSKIGEADLAWIAAERGMNSAEQADDPLVIASVARAGTHAFLANGRYDDAMTLGTTAATWLHSRMDETDPAALSLAGMLKLRTAIAAARHQDRATSAELLHEADLVAERLGEDANCWQTGFGPTNVVLHRISAALDLGDIAYVVEHGPRVDASHLPVERVASHLVDTGRAQSLVAHDDDALANFLEAERMAPQLVRHSPLVREAVKAMLRRAPVSAGRKSSPLLGLGTRCRAVA